MPEISEYNKLDVDGVSPIHRLILKGDPKELALVLSIKHVPPIDLNQEIPYSRYLFDLFHIRSLLCLAINLGDKLEGNISHDDRYQVAYLLIKNGASCQNHELLKSHFGQFKHFGGSLLSEAVEFMPAIVPLLIENGCKIITPRYDELFGMMIMLILEPKDLTISFIAFLEILKTISNDASFLRDASISYCMLNMVIYFVGISQKYDFKPEDIVAKITFLEIMKEFRRFNLDSTAIMSGIAGICPYVSYDSFESLFSESFFIANAIQKRPPAISIPRRGEEKRVTNDVHRKRSGHYLHCSIS